FPEGERTFTLRLLPSAAGFTTITSQPTVQGFDQSVRVAAYALDRSTGIGVLQQTPQPGPGIGVHFHADAPVQLGKTAAVLTADAPQITLDYTIPPLGQRASLTVITDNNSAVAAVTSTLKVGTDASAVPATLKSVVLPRGALGQVSLNGITLPATVTSSDPQNVLVSANATDAGAASVQLAKGASTLYVHALGDSGSYALQVDSPAAVPSTISVGLQPLQ